MNNSNNLCEAKIGHDIFIGLVLFCGFTYLDGILNHSENEKPVQLHIKIKKYIY